MNHQEANVTHYELLSCAQPIDRVMLLDAIAHGNAAGDLLGNLGERLRSREAGTSQPSAHIACSRCRGQINRACVICGGHGSIRFVPEPDEVLDHGAITTKRDYLEGSGR